MLLFLVRWYNPLGYHGWHVAVKVRLLAMGFLDHRITLYLSKRFSGREIGHLTIQIKRYIRVTRITKFYKSFLLDQTAFIGLHLIYRVDHNEYFFKYMFINLIFHFSILDFPISRSFDVEKTDQDTEVVFIAS